jgi:hypothetical protein
VGVWVLTDETADSPWWRGLPVRLALLVSLARHADKLRSKRLIVPAVDWQLGEDAAQCSAGKRPPRYSSTLVSEPSSSWRRITSLAGLFSSISESRWLSAWSTAFRVRLSLP